MAATLIRPADVVPLTLQMEDGAAGLFPQAVVRNPAGAVLTTADLAAVGAGLYTFIGFVMPAGVDWITVTYITYTDAGHAAESPTHLRAEDVFVTDTSAEPGAAMALTAGAQSSLIGLIFAEAVEVGVTFLQACRAIAAAVCGNASSGPANSNFKAIGNSGTTRMVSNANAVGDRTVQLSV